MGLPKTAERGLTDAEREQVGQVLLEVGKARYRKILSNGCLIPLGVCVVVGLLTAQLTHVFQGQSWIVSITLALCLAIVAIAIIVSARTLLAAWDNLEEFRRYEQSAVGGLLTVFSGVLEIDEAALRKSFRPAGDTLAPDESHCSGTAPKGWVQVTHPPKLAGVRIDASESVTVEVFAESGYVWKVNGQKVESCIRLGT